METISNSTHFEKIIVNHILESGLTWNYITHATGISQEVMSCKTARITPEQHYKLLNMLQKHRGLDWLNLKNNFSIEYLLNKNNILDSFSQSSPEYAALVLNCENLRTALRNFIKFRTIVGNINEFNLIESSNTITMTYKHHFPELRYSFVSIINFIFVIFISNTYSNKENIKFQISCTCSKSPYLEGICRYWNSKILWQQESDSIIFTCKNLDTPYQQFNQATHDILLKIVQNKNDEIYKKDNIKDIVSSVIRNNINDRNIYYSSSKSIHSICEILNINKIKLSRRLKEVGTSYKIIEKSVKLEESVKMLQYSNKSIAEISEQLGFSTQSVFNRFFNELMNTTPLKYRKKIKG
ncbi:helix-turn-helix transcriptional regulator [Vibrio salinus]|uniref:helix-turn-helix transcriptional regulator n=1 Tax=Vibrio salinus TaxID=2899784 RepID=UPI001E3D6A00|nr:helix-turn-helix transcriptional regulator [Vibrio salinus]MCE0493145.1 helix-turn-helix transcriptional regulator [Vibrio salinus]